MWNSLVRQIELVKTSFCSVNKGLTVSIGYIISIVEIKLAHRLQAVLNARHVLSLSLSLVFTHVATVLMYYNCCWVVQVYICKHKDINFASLQNIHKYIHTLQFWLITL